MLTRGWVAAVGRGGAVMVLVGAVLVPGRASAQPAAAPVGMQVNADAQQLFFDGQAATKQKQWDRARTFFQGAWRIQQHWKIAVSLGRAELKVGRMRDAAEHLAFFLREVPAGVLTPADRAQVDEMLAQARATVGAVKVTGAPEGAEVALDGVVVGKAPLEGELFVEPGPHRVEARRSGYVDGGGAVAAVAGREAGVDLRMVRVPVVKPLAPVGPVAGGSAASSAVGPNRAVVMTGVTLTAVAAAAGVGLGIGLGVERAGEPMCTHACTHLKNLMFWSFAGALAAGGATLTYTLTRPKPTPGGVSQASLWAGQSGLGATFARTW